MSTPSSIAVVSAPATNDLPQGPLPRPIAWRAVARCAVMAFVLLARRRTHLSREHVGIRLWFADGTSAPVYRETVVDHDHVDDSCALVVAFRLRHVHGWGHTLFRWESLLNTVLFVGFEGLVSKLWLADDDREVYRGVYEWDGPERATYYARCLWRVLALVSEPDSIRYVVVPGLGRDQLLAGAMAGPAPDWWRVVRTT